MAPVQARVLAQWAPMSTTEHDAALTIDTQFRGPARSGNGGYTSGSLAERVRTRTERAVIEVTLRRPPPLATALDVRHLEPTDPENPHAEALSLLSFGRTTVAEAHEVDRELAPVDAVAPDLAADAMSRYKGLRWHPFPGCFTCGTDRAEGDGLQIYPGPVGEDTGDTVASLWVPHRAFAESGDVLDTGLERVGVGTTWAALDCVGGWSEDLEGRPSVLGRMTARVDALPVVGEPHVVVGHRLRSEGRKTFTASTLYDTDGRVVATAEHVWIQIDPADFN
jgi:hypothetical protein